MRQIILFLIFISSVCLAQDTLVIDARIAKSVGKSVKYKFKSQTTGANQKINLKTGLWEYRDANDNLIKTETFLSAPEKLATPAAPPRTNDVGAGFGGNTNKVTLIDKNLVQTVYPLKSKANVAADIMTEIQKQINA